jgi:hypothetical protein
VQTWSAAHALPHEPQLASSLFRSRHELPQSTPPQQRLVLASLASAVDASSVGGALSVALASRRSTVPGGSEVSGGGFIGLDADGSCGCCCGCDEQAPAAVTASTAMVMRNGRTWLVCPRIVMAAERKEQTAIQRLWRFGEAT